MNQNLVFLAAALKRREVVSIELDARKLDTIIQKITPPPKPSLLELLASQGLSLRDIVEELK